MLPEAAEADGEIEEVADEGDMLVAVADSPASRER